MTSTARAGALSVSTHWAAVPHLLLAGCWLTVAVAKLTASPLGPVSVEPSRGGLVWLADLLAGLPTWLPTVVEVLLATLCVCAGLSGRSLLKIASATASGVVACLLLGIALISTTPPRCGCFGAITSPLRAQRIGVAGGLLALSALSAGGVASRGMGRSLLSAGSKGEGEAT